MTWLAAAVAGLVAGAAVGLLASALGLGSNQGRRLDLFPALAGAAAAVIAARVGGVTQFERLLNGVVVIPLLAVAGGIVALVVGDRPRAAAQATRNVLVPVSIAFAGQAALWQWTGGRVFLVAERTGGLTLSDVLVVTWVEAAAVGIALVSVALLHLALRRGRTGRWWRTAEESPEVLALSGVEPGRLAARVSGLTAAAGAVAGLLLAGTGPIPAPGVADLGLRAGEASGRGRRQPPQPDRGSGRRAGGGSGPRRSLPGRLGPGDRGVAGARRRRGAPGSDAPRPTLRGPRSARGGAAVTGTAPVAGRAEQAGVLHGRVRLAVMAILIVGVGTTPLWSSTSAARVLVDLLVLVAITQLWSYLAGAAGIVWLGVNGIAGVGAYALWFLGDRGVNPVLAVGGAGLVAGVVAFVSAPLVLRLPSGLAAAAAWIVGAGRLRDRDPHRPPGRRERGAGADVGRGARLRSGGSGQLAGGGGRGRGPRHRVRPPPLARRPDPGRVGRRSRTPPTRSACGSAVPGGSSGSWRWRSPAPPGR